MSVKTKKFRALHTTLTAIRNDVVRAIRVTDRNYESVADWAKGEPLNSLDKQGQTTKRRVRVKTPKGWRVARVGDFVVKNVEGKFFVGKDDAFEAGFELVR